MLLLLIALSLIWTTSWTKAESTALAEGDLVPLELCLDLNGEPCFWQGEGVYYPLEAHNSLIQALQGRRHRYESAEDTIAVLEARIARMGKQLERESQRLLNCEEDVIIAKESCPSMWERHVGWCAGVGASINTDGDVDASANVTYGFRF